LPGVRENSPRPADRMRDISSWKEGDISSLTSREKKHYNKRKSAIRKYFKTDGTLDEIAHRHHLSVAVLLKLAEECLMQHEDGTPWGFRALLPGVKVIDHTPQPAPDEAVLSNEDLAVPSKETSNGAEEQEGSTILVYEAVDGDEENDTSKHLAVKLSLLAPSFDTGVPETPLPRCMDDEDEKMPVEEKQPAGSEEGVALEIEPAAPETPGEIETPLEEQGKREVEETQVTAEAEDAIAEAERLLEAQKEADIEYGGTSTHDVEVEEVRFRAKVTMPIPVVAVRPNEPNESNGHYDNVTALAPLMLPVPSRKQEYFAFTKKTAQRRLILKHWQREAQGKQKQRHLQRMLVLAVLAALVLFVLVPAGAGLAAYSAYNQISAVAHDGVNHLLKVKSLLNVSKTDPTAALNETKLKQSQLEFTAAESDFVELQQLVGRPDVQWAITQFAQSYSNKFAMAQSLIQVGLDVSRMGKELCGVALIGANIIHGSPLASGSAKPLITGADVLAIEGSLVHALYYINDIRFQLSHVSLKDLPISDAQKAQVSSILPLLPKAEALITQAQGLVGPVSWLLGVGQQRRFLIQTMDSAELRPGGGFTGQYGVLQIQNGRMSRLGLTDVTQLDYNGNGTATGHMPPPGYSWMTFPNFGLRDSNLSGDFPTTAHIAMQVFEDEGGGPVDGDIAFTPTLIGHIIDITGPIKVPGYGETITSKNLEERLHYYQQDFSAIAREQQISGNYSHTGRKAFTSTLGQLVLDRVRHLPMNKLMLVAKSAIRDIQSRDLEIYFTNPVAEAYLVAHGYGASIDTFSKQDGFMVIQGNYSISKASQYVHTTEHDDVTLDAQGNATHNLTITLDYKQTGPVYGYDTYADYIRVYAPQSASLITGDGFDSGHTVCSRSGPSGCGSASFQSARYCPNGNYSLGIEWAKTPWPVDSLGPPTELTSDLPGRAMWGGLTLTPKNCISYITLSWSVPHDVQKVHGQPSYSILVQKQSGVTPTIELSIDASAIKGMKSFQFKGDIITDKSFTLSPLPAKK
jgi:Protein of unknown function (DUF4012)